MSLVALLCIFSSISMSFLRWSPCLYIQYSKWGLTIALYRGTIKLFSLYVIFLRIIPRTWLPLDAAILHCSETFMLAIRNGADRNFWFWSMMSCFQVHSQWQLSCKYALVQCYVFAIFSPPPWSFRSYNQNEYLHIISSPLDHIFLVELIYASRFWTMLIRICGLSQVSSNILFWISRFTPSQPKNLVAHIFLQSQTFWNMVMALRSWI